MKTWLHTLHTVTFLMLLEGQIAISTPIAVTCARDVHCKLYSLCTCKYPTRLSNVVLFESRFCNFCWYFLGTYNVSGVHLVTTGRATGNIFMIFSVAMRCRWLCGVCSIQSAFSSL